MKNMIKKKRVTTHCKGCGDTFRYVQIGTAKRKFCILCRLIKKKESNKISNKNMSDHIKARREALKGMSPEALIAIVRQEDETRIMEVL